MKPTTPYRSIRERTTNAADGGTFEVRNDRSHILESWSQF